MNQVKIKCKSGEILFYPEAKWDGETINVGYEKEVQVRERREMKRQWPLFWKKKEVVTREAGTIKKFVMQGWLMRKEIEYVIVEGSGIKKETTDGK